MTVKSKKMVKKIDSERKVKVYRIEHPEDRYGPFGWGDYDAEHTMNRHLPTPYCDEKLYELEIKKSHVFGCRYKSLLKEWIKDEKELDKMGFVVRTYEVEKKHVHHGDYQSVFLKNKASCVEEKSVIEFFSRKKGN
jgi:hypothetical protein